MTNLVKFLDFWYCVCVYVCSYEELLLESSDEEEEPKKKRITRKTSAQDSQATPRGQAWIKEGGEDEPLNFLDPSVTQRVSGECYYD
jgi:hypothetical protein